jgi:hypothetical protein
MRRFLIAMREDDGAWSQVGAEQQQRILEHYFDWIDALSETGAYEGGEPLAPGGRVLRAVDGTIVDGPFTETKEVLTGFFIIRAENMDAARALALTCPALTHGLDIELREIIEYAR